MSDQEKEIDALKSELNKYKEELEKQVKERSEYLPG